MKHLIVGIVILFSGPAKAQTCALDPTKLAQFFEMDYQSFDQTQGKGFRELEDKGCFFEAALAIDAWRSHKLSTLMDWQIRVSFFHAGQAYASVDSSLYAAGIRRLQNSLDPSEPQDQELKWNSYVEATVAFLSKDKSTLINKREEVATSNSSFNLKNLAVIDRLIKCFDRSYLEAYAPGGLCGP